MNITIYAMIVQDETGGMYIESQSKLNVTAGDSINGIFGSYHGYIALKSATSIKVLSQNNLKNIVTFMKRHQSANVVDRSAVFSQR